MLFSLFTNEFLDSAGVCRCLAGYIESLDGASCVQCSSITTNKLIDTATSVCTNPCVVYAAPDTTNSNTCTCQTGTSQSHEFWDNDNQQACVQYSSMTGIGADTSTGECGIQAFLKETGECACLDSTSTVPSGVSVTYNSGADFCYRTGTTPECVKDATSSTIGLLYTTCTSTGFELTINEQCRSNDYSGIAATLFYVGTNSANCKFSTQG